MSKVEIERLITGFKKFKERYFSDDKTLYQQLSVTTGSGQSPKTLVIACSDSRVDPAIITSASPGELFVIRNVANLVPPYEAQGGYHGVSAAIEFAVVNLKVENIIVMGHRQCGGIRALMLNEVGESDGFVNQWVKIAQSAKDKVLDCYPSTDEDTLCKHGELESITTSLQNLRTFPFVVKAIKDRNLSILGIYFDLEKGQLLQYNENDQKFNSIEMD